MTAVDDVTVLTWADITAAAERLVERRPAPLAVYGVPRGGLIPAAMVASLWRCPVADHPAPGVLIIDDLVDSGRTLTAWTDNGFDVDALFRKPASPANLAPDALVADGWLVFPWEHHDGGQDGPTDAVRRLLQFIGEDPEREGLLDTPKRVVKAYAEMTAGYSEDPAAILSTTFDDRCDEMVMLRGIDFVSLCEHHLLPFTGTAVVGYVPGDRVVGLSKLARLVECYARRLQVQERLTNQIAYALLDHLDARGVGVVIRAHHSCMGNRGVRKPGAEMVTSAMLGVLRDDTAARAEFLALADRP